MKEKQYGIKWKVSFSIGYVEYLLNLTAQGYFDELQEEIRENTFNATKTFAEELCRIHYVSISNLITKN